MGVEPAVVAADHDHGVRVHVEREVLARLPHLAGVASEEPAAAPDAREVELVDAGIGRELALEGVAQPLLRDQAVEEPFGLRESRRGEVTAHARIRTPCAPSWYEGKLEALGDKRIVIPLTFTYASSERLVAQQGRFTMCFKIHQKHDCIIEQIDARHIRRLLIPHEKKPEFLLRLRDMNITGATLFPGVDGLAQSVRELVALGAHYKALS